MMSRQNYLMKRIHIARWSMYILFIYLSHVGSRKKWDIYPLQTQLVRNVKKIWNNHQYQREFQRPLFSVDLNVEVMRSTEIGLPEAKCVSADFARFFFFGSRWVCSVWYQVCVKCFFSSGKMHFFSRRSPDGMERNMIFGFHLHDIGLQHLSIWVCICYSWWWFQFCLFWLLLSSGSKPLTICYIYIHTYIFAGWLDHHVI